MRAMKVCAENGTKLHKVRQPAEVCAENGLELHKDERMEIQLPRSTVYKQKTQLFSWVSVRAKGLEPPRLSALDPKSSAATNYATPAGPYWDCKGRHYFYKCKFFFNFFNDYLQQYNLPPLHLPNVDYRHKRLVLPLKEHTL